MIATTTQTLRSQTTYLTHQDVREAAQSVLRVWGLLPHTDRFLSSADGLAVLAHLCNAGAKFFDSSLYDDKPMLVHIAATNHPFSWYRDGVVYIESVVGQLSFHVFEDSGGYDGLIERTREDGPWAGGWMQDGAFMIALAFLGLLTEMEEVEFNQWLERNQPKRGGP